MNKQKNYKSPLKKLMRFFEESRNNWKAKHQESKKENKRLKHKVRTLLCSRKKWKEEVLDLRKQLKEISTKIGRVSLESSKKNTALPP